MLAPPVAGAGGAVVGEGSESWRATDTSSSSGSSSATSAGRALRPLPRRDAEQVTAAGWPLTAKDSSRAAAGSKHETLRSFFHPLAAAEGDDR